MSDQVKGGAGGIVAVDLVEPATGLISLKCGAAVENSFQVNRTIRTVEAGETEHDAIVVENQLFGLAENLCRLAFRFSGGCFSDDAVVVLRVNARAGGEQDRHPRERCDEIAGAFEVNGAVGIAATTATGSGAVDDRGWRRVDRGCDRVHFISGRQVAGVDGAGCVGLFRSGEADGWAGVLDGYLPADVAKTGD